MILKLEPVIAEPDNYCQIVYRFFHKIFSLTNFFINDPSIIVSAYSAYTYRAGKEAAFYPELSNLADY